MLLFFFFQAEDGIRDLVRSRGLGDVYKRQAQVGVDFFASDLSQKPVDIALAAKQWAKTHFHDLSLIHI